MLIIPKFENHGSKISQRTNHARNAENLGLNPPNNKLHFLKLV